MKFYSRSVGTDEHGTETLSLLGPKIGKLFQNKIKSVEPFQVFKTAIKIGNRKNAHTVFATPTLLRLASCGITI